MTKKQRIKELEKALETANRDLKDVKEELISVKRKWEVTTKENVEMGKMLDELNDSISRLPDGCKIGTLCRVCGHHKRIYSRILGYSIDACDAANSCSKYAPMDCVEVKDD